MDPKIRTRHLGIKLKLYRSMKIRRQFAAEFNAKVTLEAIKVKRVRRQASTHPAQVQQWKEQFLADSRNEQHLHLGDRSPILWLSNLHRIKTLRFAPSETAMSFLRLEDVSPIVFMIFVFIPLYKKPGQASRLYKSCMQQKVSGALLKSLLLNHATT